MTIDEKLDIILNRRKIKRVEFAESVGITYRAFAYYMSGTRKPRHGILERIAKKLDVSTEFLLDDNQTIELTKEEELFRKMAKRGVDTSEAERFLSKSRGLFAGNALSDDDKANLMRCLAEIYEDSRNNGNK